LFVVVTLILVFVSTSPLLAAVISFPDSSEQFTELWVLDSSHATENYPFNVTVNELYTVFVTVSNRMHGSEYYLVKVKLRNIAQYLVEANSSQASSVASLYEFRSLVADKNFWESSVTFGFQDVSFMNDTVAVGTIVVNDMVLPVDASAVQDNKTGCFYFQLFFELWRYDVELQSLEFDDRYVGLWLNMTSSS
jgi:hypothetical protein